MHPCFVGLHVKSGLPPQNLADIRRKSASAQIFIGTFWIIKMTFLLSNNLMMTTYLASLLLQNELECKVLIFLDSEIKSLKT
jgi:hypothetical protein